MSIILDMKRVLRRAESNFYIYGGSVLPAPVTEGMEDIANSLPKEAAIKTLRKFTANITRNPKNWGGFVVSFFNDSESEWEVVVPVDLKEVMAADLDLHIKDLVEVCKDSQGDHESWIGYAWVSGISPTIDWDALKEPFIEKMYGLGMRDESVRQANYEMQKLRLLKKTACFE